MTIVYLVWETRDEYEEPLLMKLFSTKEKAEAYVEERKKELAKDEFFNFMGFSHFYWYIAEETVE